jgi:hypothetical protein
VGGTFAGAVAGVLFPILADPWMPNQDWALAAAWIAIPVGALVGFLLGFCPTALAPASPANDADLRRGES